MTGVNELNLPWVISSEFKLPNDESGFAFFWPIPYAFVNPVVTDTNVRSELRMLGKLVGSADANGLALLPFLCSGAIFVIEGSGATNSDGLILL